MTNQETMTLSLKRINVCDIRLALTGLIIDMRHELREESTSNDRKEILTRSIAKWEALKAEVVRQFDAQDEASPTDEL